MLNQRRRRWVYVIQMLYKCFVFVGEFIDAHIQTPSSTLHEEPRDDAMESGLYMGIAKSGTLHYLGLMTGYVI